MDFRSRHDNADAASEGTLAMADKVVTNLKDLASTVRNKAKAKKAQKISDAGGYFTLTPFQKSLIDVPAYAVSAGVTAEDAKNAEAVPVTTGQLKKYLPYILGVVVLVVLFFIIKSKK